MLQPTMVLTCQVDEVQNVVHQRSAPLLSVKMIDQIAVEILVTQKNNYSPLANFNHALSCSIAFSSVGK